MVDDCAYRFGSQLPQESVDCSPNDGSTSWQPRGRRISRVWSLSSIENWYVKGSKSKQGLEYFVARLVVKIRPGYSLISVSNWTARNLQRCQESLQSWATFVLLQDVPETLFHRSFWSVSVVPQNEVSNTLTYLSSPRCALSACQKIASPELSPAILHP